MSSDALNLASPHPKADREEMFDIISKTFSGNGYFNFLNRCRNSYIGGSHYDWGASTIGRMGGKMVTHWGVWGYDMRIGRSSVRVAGIGAVSTHGEYRKRRLMSRTIARALPVMRDAGYDMTLLFGINDYYHRFGYVRAFPSTTYIVAVGQLPTDKPSPRCRKLKRLPLAEMAPVYNRRSADLTATAVRPTYRKAVFLGDQEGLFWPDAKGKLAGWVLTHGNTCVDHAGQPEQVLRVLGELARKRSWQEVRFDYLHYGTALRKRITAGTCRAETHYTRSGGAMIRTLDLRRTLEKISPELSRRIAASNLSGWRGTLAVCDARERVVLKIGGGKVGVIDGPAGKNAVRGGQEVAQLIIGTDEPRAICAAAGMKATGEAARLLDVLFPAQHPCLAGADRF